MLFCFVLVFKIIFPQALLCLRFFFFLAHSHFVSFLFFVRLSQRASDGATLPGSDVEKLIGAKTLLAGYGNARFIAMAKYDLAMHGDAAPADAEALAALWHTLYAERVGIDVDESVPTHFCTTWCVGHSE